MSKLQCYWDGTGEHQATYSTLFDKLVPASGMADTVHGEAIRAISRLSHETYNNGCGNMFCSVEYETTINRFYYDFIDTVDFYLKMSEGAQHVIGVRQELKRAHRDMYQRSISFEEFSQVFEPIMNRVVICAAKDDAKP